MKPFGAWHPNIMALLQATPEVLKLAVYPPLCGIFGARLPPHLWISKYVPICTQYVQYVCDILPTHWTLCSPLVFLTIQCKWANFCVVHVSWGGVYKNFTTRQGGGAVLVSLATEIVHLEQSPTCAPTGCCLYLLLLPPHHGLSLNTWTEGATCACHAGTGMESKQSS